MRKWAIAIPLLAGILFMPVQNKSVHAINTDSDLKINVTGNQLTIPQNTKCREIDYAATSTEIKRTAPDGRTTFSGKDSKGDLIDDIYDLCIGSFPRFPSTKVEGGINPYYYLKYRLLPDPMPVYDITTTPVKISGSEIIGVKQSFDIDMSYEATDKPSDEDIFLSYPYDSSHVTVKDKNGNMLADENIKGPYQIGYNSYFHNTYRSRYFASKVSFDFAVLEPKKDSTYTTTLENEVIEDKTVLFTGEIIYTIPDSCYEKTYLDYTEECREIEFYFPKGANIGGKTPTYKGNVDQSISTSNSNGSSKSENVVPKSRSAYMNPGEHNLIVNVKENTQLRVQKDIGTEYQTVGNKNNVARSESPYTNTVVYFNRTDKNIDGSSIEPITRINQIAKHTTKTVANSNATNTEKSGSDWIYNPQKNTNWLNYCDTNTDNWGDKDTSSRNNNSGGTTVREDQKDKTCFHNDSLENHFWQYKWSNTGWYAKYPYNGL